MGVEQQSLELGTIGGIHLLLFRFLWIRQWNSLRANVKIVHQIYLRIIDKCILHHKRAIV